MIHVVKFAASHPMRFSQSGGTVSRGSDLETEITYGRRREIHDEGSGAA
jgi:hypothetical protein